MNAGIMNVNISDHQIVFITKKKQKDIRKKVVFRGRSYKKFDEVRFIEYLTNHDWKLFDNDTNPESCWKYYISVITEYMDKVCPIKDFKVKIIKEQWMNNELLERIKDKDELLKNAKKSKRLEDRFRARKARNEVNAEIRRAKRDYIMQKVDNNIMDSKKFWKDVSEILPKGTKKSKEINLVDVETGIEVDPQKLSDYINNYFAKIGPELAKNMDKTWEFAGKDCEEELENIEITTEEVKQLCQNIDTTKSSALENLSSRIMKIAFLAQTQRLTKILNRIIKSGNIPLSWKEGIITPILKGGDPTQVQNLRPITLLPVQEKILEKIIHKRLMNHIDMNHILSDKQGGYRKEHSTLDTIAQLTDDILEARNIGEVTMVAYIDMKKAFDTVNHTILMLKLGKYGIRGKIKKLISNYLSNRVQKTRANGMTSGECEIRCGVPQGSVLGPLLFLLYVNDINNVIINSKIHMYADDTVIYISGKNINIMQKLIQKDLEKFTGWCTSNKLSVNTTKTRYMIFSPKALKKSYKEVKLSINDEILQQVHSYKYLGIMLDPDLNYEMFLKQQLKNISYRAYTLVKIAGYLSSRALLKIYNAYILPIIDQGDFLYIKSNKQLLMKLQRLQNKCLKTCLKLNIRTPTEQIHQITGMPYLEDRREAHIRNFAYKRSRKDKYIDKELKNTRMWRAPVLKRLSSNCIAYDRSIRELTAKAWNPLDDKIRNLETYKLFKYKTKRDLLMKNKIKN